MIARVNGINFSWQRVYIVRMDHVRVPEIKKENSSIGMYQKKSRDQCGDRMTLSSGTYRTYSSPFTAAAAVAAASAAKVSRVELMTSFGNTRPSTNSRPARKLGRLPSS